MSRRGPRRPARTFWIGGGAETIQQYLAAGLVDEMLLNVVPIMLGDGERLFDNLGGADPGLEQVEAIAGPDAAHLRYRLRP